MRLTTRPMSVARRCLVVAAVVSIAICPLGVSTLALAETPEPDGYAQLVDAAVQEFSLGNYAEARSLFLAANARSENARLLRGLAKVEFELRNYTSSILYIDRALRSEARPLTDTQRSELEALRKRALDYTATVEFRLEPEAAQLLMDGAPLERDPSGVARLNVGRHEVVARASGYADLHRQLDLLGGQRQRVELSLAPLAGGEAEAPAPTVNTAGQPLAPETSLPSEGMTRKKKRWVIAMSAVVAVAAGGAVAALTLRDAGGDPAPPQSSTGVVFDGER